MAKVPIDPKRSELMSRIRGKDTRPELAVRRHLHAEGYRFRVNVPNLPGRPDIVFQRRRKIVFVHGCFWHRHKGCVRTTTPKTRTEYWTRKFAQNQARDSAVASKLKEAGWDILIVWECETNNSETLLKKLKSYLGSTRVFHKSKYRRLHE